MIRSHPPLSHEQTTNRITHNYPQLNIFFTATILSSITKMIHFWPSGNMTMWWELTGDRGDKWLNGVLPTWSVNPYKVLYIECFAMLLNYFV